MHVRAVWAQSTRIPAAAPGGSACSQHAQRARTIHLRHPIGRDEPVPLPRQRDPVLLRFVESPPPTGSNPRARFAQRPLRTTSSQSMTLSTLNSKSRIRPSRSRTSRCTSPPTTMRNAQAKPFDAPVEFFWAAAYISSNQLGQQSTTSKSAPSPPNGSTSCRPPEGGGSVRNIPEPPSPLPAYCKRGRLARLPGINTAPGVRTLKKPRTQDRDQRMILVRRSGAHERVVHRGHRSHPNARRGPPRRKRDQSRTRPRIVGIVGHRPIPPTTEHASQRLIGVVSGTLRDVRPPLRHRTEGRDFTDVTLGAHLARRPFEQLLHRNLNRAHDRHRRRHLGGLQDIPRRHRRPRIRSDPRIHATPRRIPRQPHRSRTPRVTRFHARKPRRPAQARVSSALPLPEGRQSPSRHTRAPTPSARPHASRRP